MDILITPTTPTPPFKIGEKIDDPLKMYLSDIFTISSNLAGIPSINLPVGFTSSGLPIGMQVIAPHLREDILIKFGLKFEKISDYTPTLPEI